MLWEVESVSPFKIIIEARSNCDGGGLNHQYFSKSQIIVEIFANLNKRFNYSVTFF